jgi:hypothetical protein
MEVQQMLDSKLRNNGKSETSYGVFATISFDPEASDGNNHFLQVKCGNSEVRLYVKDGKLRLSYDGVLTSGARLLEDFTEPPF